MLNNITNFFNLIRTGMVKSQLESSDLLPVGTRDSAYGGNYKPTMVKYSDLAAQILSGVPPLTIGITPIASGTAGKLLYEGAGNVLNESPVFNIDPLTGFLGAGTTTPQFAIDMQFSTLGFYSDPTYNAYFGLNNGSLYLSSHTRFVFNTSLANSALTIEQSGNILINTVFDAGFKLDVNGTARVANALTVQDFSVSRGNNPAVLGNVAIGEVCLSANISGIYNFAFGTYALRALATGNYNIGIGLSAIETGTGGSGNVAIGRQAMYFGGAASNSVAIGHQAGDNAGTGSNNIYIGYQARGIGGTESNRTWIGNSSTTTTWLAGNVLIGTTTNAGFRLDVNGTARVSGNTTFGGTIGSGGDSNFVIAAGNWAVNITSNNPTNGQGSLITTGAITTTDNGTKNVINVNNAVTSTSASFNTLNGFAFTSTINQTLGTIRGLFIAPTITASTNFRAIETTQGNVLFGSTSGNVLIGTTTDAGFKLDVNGTARVTGAITATGGISLGSSVFPTTAANSISLTAHVAATDIVNLSYYTGAQSATSSIKNVIASAITFSPIGGNAVFNQLNFAPTINQTGGANGAVRGFYYNPTVTSVLGTHHAIHTTAGRVRFEGLPTSSVGLSSGDIWNDGGIVKIV